MIFKLCKRPIIGIILYVILLACGVDFLLMLLTSFGIKIIPDMLTTLPVKIIMSCTFICWIWFYYICSKKFLFLFFREIELYNDKIVVYDKSNKTEFMFTDKTFFDGLQIKELLKDEKVCSLAINFILIGTDNLGKLIDTLDRRSNRFPFQF